MLFSIITVCLNPGSDLLPTIRSVLDQNFDGFELIIKDGGSTDGSLACIPSDPRIRVVSTPDAGIFDAMNQALDLAKGDCINFLNAGDALVDERVLSDAAAMIRANPAVPFIYGDVEKPTSRSGYELYPKRLGRWRLFMDSVCHQAWFVRRETYLTYGGFETEHPTGADLRLLLKMLLRDRIEHAHVGRVVVRYRGGGRSAQPSNAAASEASCDELKRELFGPFEYAALSCFAGLTAAAKRVIYDSLLWRAFRLVQMRRVDMRQAAVAHAGQSKAISRSCGGANTRPPKAP